MARPTDPILVDAIVEALTNAWRYLQTSYAKEKLYAFGLLTTTGAEYFAPFAMGEMGLTEVAERYVQSGHDPDIDTARTGLRWSTADSPYVERLRRYGKPIEAVLKNRISIYDDVPEPKIAREVRDRLDAAVAALKALDKSNLFGATREHMLLMIEAGDRDDEWAERLLRKLNPPDRVKEHLAQFSSDERHYVGKFDELGTKKVYTTDAIACSGDRRLVATASEYLLFLFDVSSRKQMLSKPVPNRIDGWVIDGVSLSDDGSTLAAISDFPDAKKAFLCILDGKDWKQQTTYKLPIGMLAMVGAGDGSWYAVGYQDNVIRVVDRAGGDVATLKEAKDWPRGLARSPDDSLLVSADHKSGLHVYRTQDWKHMRQMNCAADGVSFHPTKPLVLSTLRWGPDDAMSPIDVWNVETGKPDHRYDVPGFAVQCAAFSPDGKWIAAGVQNATDILHNEVVLIDAHSGRVVERFRNKFEWVNDVLFLPEQRAIAVGVKGHTMRSLVLWYPNHLST